MVWKHCFLQQFPEYIWKVNTELQVQPFFLLTQVNGQRMTSWWWWSESKWIMDRKQVNACLEACVTSYYPSNWFFFSSSYYAFHRTANWGGGGSEDKTCEKKVTCHQNVSELPSFYLQVCVTRHFKVDTSTCDRILITSDFQTVWWYISDPRPLSSALAPAETLIASQQSFISLEYQLEL